MRDIQNSPFLQIIMKTSWPMLCTVQKHHISMQIYSTKEITSAVITIQYNRDAEQADREVSKEWNIVQMPR